MLVVLWREWFHFVFSWRGRIDLVGAGLVGGGRGFVSALVVLPLACDVDVYYVLIAAGV